LRRDLFRSKDKTPFQIVIENENRYGLPVT